MVERVEWIVEIEASFENPKKDTELIDVIEDVGASRSSA
jgi:hypothetical protein